MPISTLVGLSRQVGLEREMDVVANNIANMNTTGYKADGSLFEEYLSSAASAAQTGSRVSYVRDRGVWHDMSQGPIERTGNPLDVAVDGKALLVVQTPNGERYTRNGSMQINANGQLVTSDGYPAHGARRGDRPRPRHHQHRVAAACRQSVAGPMKRIIDA